MPGKLPLLPAEAPERCCILRGATNGVVNGLFCCALLKMYKDNSFSDWLMAQGRMEAVALNPYRGFKG